MNESLTPILAPLPYHQSVVELLKREESELWKWHAAVSPTAASNDALRLELLKSTYRLDRTTQAKLYEQADAMAHALGMSVPITCYQAQSVGGQLNAALWFIADEAHIVFYGAILESLSEGQIAAVIAHELGHHLLWRLEGGTYGTADRLLLQAIDQPQAEECHAATARRWRLATELFADRASLIATGSLDDTIATLVRVETGVPVVSAEAYIAQANEVLAHGPQTSQGNSHPECFLRAVALQAFHRGDADLDAKVDGWIRGALDPHDLDLVSQQTCLALTRRILHHLLKPSWMRSEAVLAHARQFFPDLTVSDAAPVTADLAIELSGSSNGLRDYVCAIALDMAIVDRDLIEVGIAHGFRSLTA